MTVSSTTARWEYTGDGSTVAFAVNNKFFADSDLDVFVDGTQQTITTHYTVSGAGEDAGGTVTFVTAPANGSEVTIIRDVPDTQTTDIPPAGAFPAESVEDALDRRTVVSQQTLEAINRALKFKSTDQSLPSAELPALSALKGNFLAFNATTGAPEAKTGAEFTGTLDVLLSSVATSDYLEYDGTQFVNKTPAQVRTTLSVPHLGSSNTFTAQPQIISSSGSAAWRVSQTGGGPTIQINTASTRGQLAVTTNHPLEFLTNNTLFAKLFTTGGFAVQATPSDPGAGKINTDNGYEVADVPHGLQRGGSLDLSSGTGGSITNLGGVTNPDIIELVFDQVSSNGTDNILVRIGDSGGDETTGYTARSHDLGASGVSSTGAVTNGFVIKLGVAAGVLSGTLTLRRRTGNVWIATFMGDDANSDEIIASGRKELSATLDRVSVLLSGSDNFDGGAAQLSAGKYN